jgi:anthranilate synthase/aminodeoxychorismate synthase-like glutamine amidotransferase
MKKAALIDNYDSFTFNLKELMDRHFDEVDVYRNDMISPIELLAYDAIFLSPGPSVPVEAGRLLDIIDFLKDKRPLFGVCLGLQAIGEVFGAKLELMDKPLHGVSRPVMHDGDEFFKDIPSGFSAARYHSWVLSTDNLPEELIVIAKSENGKIMAIRHQSLPIYGVQFHPESVLTETGDIMIKNFLNQVNIRANENLVR